MKQGVIFAILNVWLREIVSSYFRVMAINMDCLEAFAKPYLFVTSGYYYSVVERIARL